MIINLILWILFGALAGWIASIVMHTNAEQGALSNIIIGIVGAVIGGWIARSLLGIDVSGFNLTSLIIAVVGAIILLAILRAFGFMGGGRRGIANRA